jgi:hypothetical protein
VSLVTTVLDRVGDNLPLLRRYARLSYRCGAIRFRRAQPWPGSLRYVYAKLKRNPMPLCAPIRSQMDVGVQSGAFARSGAVRREGEQGAQESAPDPDRQNDGRDLGSRC